MAADYDTLVYNEIGGSKMVVADGGEIEVQSGGRLDIQDGAHFNVDIMEIADKVTIGEFHTDTAGSGIPLSPDTLAAFRVYADDGGVAITSANVKAIASRFLITVSPGDCTLEGILGQIKYVSGIHCSADYQSGIRGYLELQGGNTVNTGGANANIGAGASAVRALVGVDADTTIATNHYLCGYQAQLSAASGTTITQTGVLCAYGVFADDQSGGATPTDKWGHGFYIPSGVVDTGISIGTCPAGIDLTGTYTVGLDFSDGTIAAATTSHFLAIGTQASAKVLGDTSGNMYLTSINVTAAGDNYILGNYTKMTTSAAMAAGGFYGSYQRAYINHDIQDVYMQMGKLDFSAGTTAISPGQVCATMSEVDLGGTGTITTALAGGIYGHLVLFPTVGGTERDIETGPIKGVSVVWLPIRNYSSEVMLFSGNYGDDRTVDYGYHLTGSGALINGLYIKGGGNGSITTAIKVLTSETCTIATGLDIDSGGGAVATGIDLGTVTTGITFTGAQTTAVDISATSLTYGILIDGTAPVDGIHISSNCTGAALNITGVTSDAGILVGANGTELIRTSSSHYSVGIFTKINADEDTTRTLRGLWSRFAVPANVQVGSVDGWGEGINAIEGNVKLYGGALGTYTKIYCWQIAGVWAMLETDNTDHILFEGGSHAAGLFAHIELGSGVELTTDSAAAAVVAFSNSHLSADISSGDYVGVLVDKESGKLSFQVGLKVEDGSSAIGVDLGTCTTSCINIVTGQVVGINIAGTCSTAGINMAGLDTDDQGMVIVWTGTPSETAAVDAAIVAVTATSAADGSASDQLIGYYANVVTSTGDQANNILVGFSALVQTEHNIEQMFGGRFEVNFSDDTGTIDQGCAAVYAICDVDENVTVSAGPVSCVWGHWSGDATVGTAETSCFFGDIDDDITHGLNFDVASGQTCTTGIELGVTSTGTYTTGINIGDCGTGINVSGTVDTSSIVVGTADTGPVMAGATPINMAIYSVFTGAAKATVGRGLYVKTTYTPAGGNGKGSMHGIRGQVGMGASSTHDEATDEYLIGVHGLYLMNASGVLSGAGITVAGVSGHIHAGGTWTTVNVACGVEAKIGLDDVPTGIYTGVYVYHYGGAGVIADSVLHAKGWFTTGIDFTGLDGTMTTGFDFGDNCTTAIDIGNCTTGISFTGTCDDGIKFETGATMTDAIDIADVVAGWPINISGTQTAGLMTGTLSTTTSASKPGLDFNWTSATTYGPDGDPILGDGEVEGFIQIGDPITAVQYTGIGSKVGLYINADVVAAGAQWGLMGGICSRVTTTVPQTDDEAMICGITSYMRNVGASASMRVQTPVFGLRSVIYTADNDEAERQTAIHAAIIDHSAASTYAHNHIGLEITLNLHANTHTQAGSASYGIHFDSQEANATAWVRNTALMHVADDNWTSFVDFDADGVCGGYPAKVGVVCQTNSNDSDGAIRINIDDVAYWIPVFDADKVTGE